MAAAITRMRSRAWAIRSEQTGRATRAAHRARFEQITIRPAVKILRYPSSEEFFFRYTTSSALASVIASADDHARAELLAQGQRKIAIPY